MDRNIALLIVAIVATVAGCGDMTTPTRPSGVPSSAVWVGGRDGGAFVDCRPSEADQPNPCTVYNETIGDIWMSGTFIIQGKERGASGIELKYVGADGSRIYLQGNQTLSGVSRERPPSVPRSAQLATNGVYVDCSSIGTDAYQCSLFLAANGGIVTDGTYRCQSSGGCWERSHPTVATSAIIDLESGDALNRP